MRFRVIEGLIATAALLMTGFLIGIFAAPKSNEGEFYCNWSLHLVYNHITFGSKELEEEINDRLLREPDVCYSAHQRQAL